MALLQWAYSPRLPQCGGHLRTALLISGRVVEDFGAYRESALPLSAATQAIVICRCGQCYQ